MFSVNRVNAGTDQADDCPWLIPYFDMALLLPLDPNYLLLDQLRGDIAIIFNAFRSMVKKTLRQLTPNRYLNDLPPVIEINNRELSFSGKMQFLEWEIKSICLLFVLFARVAYENAELRGEISEANACFCLNINFSVEDVFNKYKDALGLVFKEEELFLSRRWFIPYGFNQTDIINEESMRTLYRQALLTYANTPPPITITFRDEAYGEGAFFDHYNIQKITGRETEISLPSGLQTFYFQQVVNERSLVLRGTDLTNEGKPMPAISSNNPDSMGLLVIPGYSRNTPEKRPNEHQNREQHEIKMIRLARDRQQPVLAICGGLWTLTKAMNGTTKEVQKHTGRMPVLENDGAISSNGLNVHPIYVYKGTKLARLMKLPVPPFPTNFHVTRAISVHWLAVNQVPNGFTVSAVSPSERGDTIEAIENSDPNSAAIIGIQGHPEALRADQKSLAKAAKQHHELIRNLVKEGDAYHKRRIENKEVSVAQYPSSQLLVKLGFFKEQQAVLIQRAIAIEEHAPVIDGINM